MAKPPKKPKTVKPVRPNSGVQAAYRAELSKIVDDLKDSYAAFTDNMTRENPPQSFDNKGKTIAESVEESLIGLGIQKSALAIMNEKMLAFGDAWFKRIDESAPKIAEAYLKKVANHSDRALSKALKESGFEVEFKMTARMRDAYESALVENVDLIKSIPKKYHDKVSEILRKHYINQQDEHELAKELKALYPQSENRVKLIARDQTAKANAAVTRARALDLGIKEAIWLHSGAGKEPRKSHVKANNKKYNIEEGKLIDGEYIQPGEKINCRCSMRIILPFGNKND